VSSTISNGDKSTSDSATSLASRLGILKPVFIPASIIIFGVITLVLVFAEQAEDLAGDLNSAVTSGVGWWYVIAVNIFLVFVLYCALSRIGRIRLGRDDERPEFGVVSWFMMLFSAGMGIGLVFFGVAEPLSHYIMPPEAFSNEARSTEAAQESVGLMMLQWGLHPWAIYAVVGLGLAYMSFRRGRPLAVRWILEPLLGRRRVEGWMGHTIDVVAIVGTLFGIATSFGFGISQIIAGLEYLGWMEESNTLIIGLIAVITAIAIWSVVSGVHKGLKWLSNINMGIAALLALCIFVLGPTLLILQAYPENAGAYLSQLPQTMFHTGAWAGDGWEAVWTIGYWGWWTSWAPFVGMFIARISRGRTIREFVIGTLLAPTLVSMLWFTVFGNSSIHFDQEGIVDFGDEVNSTTSLFEFLDAFPMASALSFIAIIVVVFFFVTSSDSGSLVIDMLATGGKVDTPVATRVYWSILEGAAAAVLLVVGGDAALTALQTLSVSTAAPFSVILVLGCVSLYRAFRYDANRMPSYIQVLPGPEDKLEPDSLSQRARKQVRGLRGVSTTLGGFPTGTSAEASNGDPRIVSFRPLHPDNMEFHPETGEPIMTNQGRDPLVHEVFDTPEFEASQEYIYQREVSSSHDDSHDGHDRHGHAAQQAGNGHSGDRAPSPHSEHTEDPNR
jgi:choline/glycine/proline betaine transport protein